MGDKRIDKVIFNKDYKVDILLANGEKLVCDMAPKLVTARFTELTDMELFKKGEVLDGRVIRWNLNTEISIDEMIGLAAGSSEL